MEKCFWRWFNFNLLGNSFNRWPLSLRYIYCLLPLLFIVYDFTTAYDYNSPKTVKASKEIFYSRIKSTLLTMFTIILMAIVTFNYYNQCFFILQLFYIVILWPIVVFCTDTDGFMNNSEIYKRSLFTDLKDAYFTIKSKF